MADEEEPEDRTIKMSTGTIQVEANPVVAREIVVPALELDLKNTCQDILTEIDEADSFEQFLADNKDSIVVFFTIANELLKDKGRGLLERNILKEEYQEGIIVSEFGRQKVFELLRWAEIINSETFGDVKDSFDYRDVLVHEPGERHRQYDLDELENRIRNTMEVVRRLSSIED